MAESGKRSKAKELLWLAIAVMSLIIAVHSSINKSFKESWYFYGFVLVALLFYHIWRNHRKNS
jgi:hypothetical protein